MSNTAAQYTRRQRIGKLSFRTKFSQGVGSIPEGMKNWAFNTFALLYYNQVLGVEAYLVSAALMVALFFDAVTDPIVGAYSDRLRTRWGRRHPLMLVAAIPLGLSMYAVFNPLNGLSELQLFVWLLVFSVLTRGFMTLYFVPWAAMGVELSEDYHERTSVMAYRYAIGWFVGVSASVFVFNFIMVDTKLDGKSIAGQLNPAAYSDFALLCGALMAIGALLCVVLMLREIPYLRQPTERMPRYSFKQTYSDITIALQNSQLRLKFVCILLASTVGGAMTNLMIYMQTFFWGFQSEDMAWMALSSVGALLVFPVLPAIQKRWDKKHILIFCYLLLPAKGVLLVSLRFLDVLPANGDPLLLALIVLQGMTTVFLLVLSGIISASIAGELLDDQELRTGLRQEGVFSSVVFFAEKSMTGVGIMIGGLVLTLIEFPKGMAPTDVPADAVLSLGWVVGILIPLLYLVPTLLFTRYKITRERHAEIREALMIQRKHIAE